MATYTSPNLRQFNLMMAIKSNCLTFISAHTLALRSVLKKNQNYGCSLDSGFKKKWVFCVMEKQNVMRVRCRSKKI